MSSIEIPQSDVDRASVPQIFWRCDPSCVEVPRSLCKILLKNLYKGDLTFDENLEGYLTKSEYAALRQIYSKKIQDLKKADGRAPRNIAVYQIISEYYPDFKWKFFLDIKKKSGAQMIKVITNNQSTKPGYFVSLAMFLLKRVSRVEANYFSTKLPFYFDYTDYLKAELAKFLTLIDVSKINEAQFELLHKWFLRSRKQQTATIFTGICPDYSNTCIAKNLYRFTFEGLGGGVGVSALRLAENIQKIHEFFANQNIKVRHVAAIGDFEAFSESVLKRVGETEQSFIKKLRASQQALSELIDERYQIECPLITELCGGKIKWENLFNHILNDMRRGDFGKTGIGQRELKSIGRSRKPLLQRWFPDITDRKLQDVVVWQAAEYATLSRVVHDSLSDPLIIGVDHFKMMPFYNFQKKIPILYLRSNYMENDR